MTSLFAAIALPLLIALTGAAQVTPSAGWQPLGPWGGSAEVVRSSPSDGLVLAATRNGSLFLSRTAGDSWAEVPFPARAAGVVHALEVDPRSSGVWYVGVEGNANRSSGVYRTRDGGGTWTLLPDTRGLAVWSLAIAPSDPDVVAAGTDVGIYRSGNGGDAWARMSPEGHHELRPVVSLAFDRHDTRTLLAGTTRLPWRTTDNGATWDVIATGMVDDSDVFSIVVDPRTPGRVVASACTGVYISHNGGLDWTQLPIPPGAASRVHVVAIDPHNTNVIFAGTSAGLFRSADAGASWQSVTRHAVKAITFEPHARTHVFFASTDGGLLRSSDGGRTVATVNTGFASQTFTSLDVAGKALHVNGPAGEYRSDDLRRWTTVTAGRAKPIAALRPDITLKGADAALISDDAGATWRTCTNPVVGVSWYGVARDSAAPSTALAATSRGLYRSTDGCHSWSLVAGGLETATAAAVVFHPRGGEAFVAQGGRVFRSLDGGKEWQPIGDERADFWPSALRFVDSAPDRLFALVPGRGVFALHLPSR